MKTLSFGQYKELGLDLVTAAVLSDPAILRKIAVGEVVTLEPGLEKRFGTGEFTVRAVHQLPQAERFSAGHTQHVELSKKIVIPEIGEVEMVYDSYRGCWCQEKNLSEIGRTQRTRISGYWIK
ncbi:MAG: hypothetical protein WAV41_00990 [Microgenomates group bacterium]